MRSFQTFFYNNINNIYKINKSSFKKEITIFEKYEIQIKPDFQNQHLF